MVRSYFIGGQVSGSCYINNKGSIQWSSSYSYIFILVLHLEEKLENPFLLKKLARDMYVAITEGPRLQFFTDCFIRVYEFCIFTQFRHYQASVLH